MSDSEKTVSERDAVRRERAAFIAGVAWQFDFLNEEQKGNRTLYNSTDHPRTKKAAKAAYPFPPRIEPNVVTDPEGEQWKIENATLLFRPRLGEWTSFGPLRAAYAISQVVANPTREVPDNGD